MPPTTPSTAILLRVPRLLWGALLMSQVLYAGLLVVPGLIGSGAEPEGGVSIVGMIAFAIASAIGSFVVPSLVRRKNVAAQRLELREVPDPSAPVGFRGNAPTIREYADVAAVHAAARTAGFAPFVLSLALSEAVSLMGIVAGFLGQPPVVWGAFVAVGMTLTAIRFPTEATFFAPVEQHTGVRVPR